MKAVINANAKINLYLDVVSKREDGYHNIESIMQSVSLADVVTVTKNDARGQKTEQKFYNSELACDETNLCYKAARAYFDYFNISEYDILIEVTKNIPEAAGLAGGSADAAAVIRALDELYDGKSDVKILEEIGLKVGSDVAFCIVGGTCAVTGRGENVEKISDLPEYFVLIVKSARESVSTREAYKRIDENSARCKQNVGFEEYKNAVIGADTDVIEKGAYNIFEEVMRDCLDDAQKIIDKIKEDGAPCALMSGSGPSVFGLYKNKRDAEKTASELKKLMGENCFTCVCKTV